MTDLLSLFTLASPSVYQREFLIYVSPCTFVQYLDDLIFANAAQLALRTTKWLVGVATNYYVARSSSTELRTPESL